MDLLKDNKVNRPKISLLNDLSFINFIQLLKLFKKEFKVKLSDTDVIVLLVYYEASNGGLNTIKYVDFLAAAFNQAKISSSITVAQVKRSFDRLVKYSILFPIHITINFVVTDNKYDISYDAKHIIDKYKKQNKWF